MEKEIRGLAILAPIYASAVENIESTTKGLRVRSESGEDPTSIASSYSSTMTGMTSVGSVTPSKLNR